LKEREKYCRAVLSDFDRRWKKLVGSAELREIVVDWLGNVFGGDFLSGKR
jgi:hypothetical protein